MPVTGTVMVTVTPTSSRWATLGQNKSFVQFLLYTMHIASGTYQKGIMATSTSIRRVMMTLADGHRDSDSGASGKDSEEWAIQGQKKKTPAPGCDSDSTWQADSKKGGRNMMGLGGGPTEKWDINSRIGSLSKKKELTW